MPVPALGRKHAELDLFEFRVGAQFVHRADVFQMHVPTLRGHVAVIKPVEDTPQDKLSTIKAIALQGRVSDIDADLACIAIDPGEQPQVMAEFTANAQLASILGDVQFDQWVTVIVVVKKTPLGREYSRVDGPAQALVQWQVAVQRQAEFGAQLHGGPKFTAFVIEVGFEISGPEVEAGAMSIA